VNWAPIGPAFHTFIGNIWAMDLIKHDGRYREDEKWWSRGHASLVEGPAGDWWMIYHGYENGFRTLGRQTLLEPIEWTADGRFRAKGGDLSGPLAKPAGGEAVPAGFPLSDDFSTDKLGVQWGFHNPARDEMKRIRREPGAIVIAGKSTSPRDCSRSASSSATSATKRPRRSTFSTAAKAGCCCFTTNARLPGSASRRARCGPSSTATSRPGCARP
jgi:beta-xylosidase